MVSVYQKDYNDLDDEEKKVWELSYEVLTHGDKLYGTSQQDYSHFSWVLGVLLNILRDAHKARPNPNILLEIGLSEDGYGIRVLQLKPEDIGVLEPLEDKKDSE